MTPAYTSAVDSYEMGVSKGRARSHHAAHKKHKQKKYKKKKTTTTKKPTAATAGSFVVSKTCKARAFLINKNLKRWCQENIRLDKNSEYDRPSKINACMKRCVVIDANIQRYI